MDQEFFGTKNYLWLTLGLGLLVAGFIFLGQGPADNPNSLTLAPILLVVSYVVIIPIGILVSSKKKKEDSGV